MNSSQPTSSIEAVLPSLELTSHVTQMSASQIESSSSNPLPQIPLTQTTSSSSTAADLLPSISSSPSTLSVSKHLLEEEELDPVDLPISSNVPNSSQMIVDPSSNPDSNSNSQLEQPTDSWTEQTNLFTFRAYDPPTKDPEQMISYFNSRYDTIHETATCYNPKGTILYIAFMSEKEFEDCKTNWMSHHAAMWGQPSSSSYNPHIRADNFYRVVCTAYQIETYTDADIRNALRQECGVEIMTINPISKNKCLSFYVQSAEIWEQLIVLSRIKYRKYKDQLPLVIRILQTFCHSSDPQYHKIYIKGLQKNVTAFEFNSALHKTGLHSVMVALVQERETLRTNGRAFIIVKGIQNYQNFMQFHNFKNRDGSIITFEAAKDKVTRS